MSTSGVPKNWNASKSRAAVDAAFDRLLTIVMAPSHDKNSLLGCFSYVFTPKQRDQINILAEENGWEGLCRSGVLIDANAVLHPVLRRCKEDNCPPERTIELLKMAYSSKSDVCLNKSRDRQSIMLNSHEKFLLRDNDFYATAIIEASQMGTNGFFMRPVTAYFSTDKKRSSILRRSK